MLNVVVGPGRVVGERLVEHPEVAKIAFTGSTAVGRRIGQLAAQQIKRVTLELGGKSANVIFADADLAAAAQAAPMAVFGNAGQDCCARSRILVERPALQPFLAELEAAVKALRVGDPLDPETEMGPLISADQREKVTSYLGDGAPVAFRGSAPEGPGYWFPPTVLCPVSNEDRAAREEIFGPIAAVIPFDSEEQAIGLANDTIYGLSGSIWTTDGARALRVARALETGTLSVNSNTSVRVSTPFGGFKQSGLGRELGPHALEHYTELKNVFVAVSGGLAREPARKTPATWSFFSTLLDAGPKALKNSLRTAAGAPRRAPGSAHTPPHRPRAAQGRAGPTPSAGPASHLRRRARRDAGPPPRRPAWRHRERWSRRRPAG